MGKHSAPRAAPLSAPRASTLRAYAKAFVGFLTPIVVSLAATADGGWTTGELLTALGTGLVTATGVAAIPNRMPARPPETVTTTTTSLPPAVLPIPANLDPVGDSPQG